MRDITAMQHQRRGLAFVYSWLSQRQQRPHILQLLEVERHVCRQNHVNDQGAELAELVPGQVLQYVAFLVAHYSGKRFQFTLNYEDSYSANKPAERS